MNRHTSGLICVTVALACLLHAGAAGADEKAKAKPTAFDGKVVESKKEKGVLLLSCKDGKSYPLIETGASRMLFADAALRGREVRLTGKLVKGDRLEVSNVQTYLDGKLHDVYYWCARCELGYTGPGKCLCCGEKVERVEVDAADKSKPSQLLAPQ